MNSDQQTISDWFYLYNQDIYNFLVYYTGTRDVEDLVQDVFIKAGKGLATYRNQSSPKTWLMSIARNIAIDHARKRQTKVSLTALPWQDVTFNQSLNDSPEQRLLDNEDKLALYHVINQQKRNFETCCYYVESKDSRSAKRP